jgi:hypothetical protein
MDQQVTELAQQLQARLQGLDPRVDRETFEWAHTFVSNLVAQIEKAIPALSLKRINSAESDLDEAERLPNELRSRLGERDEPDSLEEIERELGSGPEHPTGVPAKRKPGPKGRSGGVALPLPHGDAGR